LKRSISTSAETVNWQTNDPFNFERNIRSRCTKR
jgi:hypothetical protein